MVNVIKGRGPSTEQKQQIDIGSAEFGAKAAMAALTETKTQKTAPAVQPVQPDKKAPTGKSIDSRQSKSQHKTSTSKSTAKKTEKINAATRGNATGVDNKSNKQLTQKAAPQTSTNKAPAQTETAWDDPNEVTTRDDELSALEKRVARAQEAESQIESVLDVEVPLADLSEGDGLNAVSQPMRDYGNYGALQTSPDLLILMHGISDSVDQLLNANGVEMPDLANLTGEQLAEIFAKMNLKKKKNLTKEEEEAELILAGAITILATPKIREKLEELGLDAAEAVSLQGVLEKLIEQVKQDDHPYHHLYTLIKEETEYSIVPEDTESLGN